MTSENQPAPSAPKGQGFIPRNQGEQTRDLMHGLMVRSIKENTMSPSQARIIANELIKHSITKNGTLDQMALNIYTGIMAANQSADVCNDNGINRRECFYALQNSYHAALDRGAREMLGVIPRFFWKEHAATEKEPDHGLVCNISLWPLSQTIPHCKLKQQDDAREFER